MYNVLYSLPVSVCDLYLIVWPRAFPYARLHLIVWPRAFPCARLHLIVSDRGIPVCTPACPPSYCLTQSIPVCTPACPPSYCFWPRAYPCACRHLIVWPTAFPCARLHVLHLIVFDREHTCVHACVASVFWSDSALTIWRTQFYLCQGPL